MLQIWAWPLLLHQFLPPVRPVTKLCYSWWVQMHPQEFKKSLLKLNFCYSCCLYFYIYKRNTPLSLASPLCASPAGRSVEVEGSGGRPAGRGKAKLPPVTSHLLTCPLWRHRGHRRFPLSLFPGPLSSFVPFVCCWCMAWRCVVLCVMMVPRYRCPPRCMHAWPRAPVPPSAAAVFKGVTRPRRRHGDTPKPAGRTPCISSSSMQLLAREWIEWEDPAAGSYPIPVLISDESL